LIAACDDWKATPQLDAAAYFALQHNQLLPERGILGCKLAL
jgi:hypothetical protein